MPMPWPCRFWPDGRLFLWARPKACTSRGRGPFERFLLRRAKRIFVRDELTASALREQGVPAEAPGNVIVDLCFDDAPEERRNEAEWIGVLPGSREAAYDDGLRLARIIRAMSVRALFSIAPSWIR